MIILAFAAEFTMMIASLALVLPKMTFNPNCLTSHAPAIFMAYWYVLPPHRESLTKNVLLQVIIAGVRDVPFHPYLDQVLPKHLTREDIDPLCLRPRWHLGFRAHFR